MIAVSAGARVVAVDPLRAGRRRATELGVAAVVDPADGDVASAVREITGGGAAASIDAIGGVESMSASLHCLHTRGRHVQVGLMLGSAPVPADVIGLVLSRELQVFGSHGMAAHDYPQMLRRVVHGELDPGLLVRRRIGLAERPSNWRRSARRRSTASPSSTLCADHEGALSRIVERIEPRWAIDSSTTSPGASHG